MRRRLRASRKVIEGGKKGAAKERGRSPKEFFLHKSASPEEKRPKRPKLQGERRKKNKKTAWLTPWGTILKEAKGKIDTELERGLVKGR